MIVNAEGHVLGRLLTYVAKKALLGEEVIVLNAEKTLISGKKDEIFDRYSKKLEIKNLGNYTKGPFHEKRPDKMIRKALRGMLPWKKTRGREAYKRVMVYIGTPKEEIKVRHNIDIEKTKIEDLKKIKRDISHYVTVGEVCKFIGGKW